MPELDKVILEVLKEWSSVSDDACWMGHEALAEETKRRNPAISATEREILAAIKRLRAGGKVYDAPTFDEAGRIVGRGWFIVKATLHGAPA